MPNKPQYFSQPQVQEFIKAKYANSALNATAVEFLDNGRRSDNWKVTLSDNSTIVAKILPEKDAGKYKAPYLAELQQSLHEQGVPVPQLHGQGKIDNNPVLLMEYVANGEISIPDNAEVIKIAETIAALHSATDLPQAQASDKYDKGHAQKTGGGSNHILNYKTQIRKEELGNTDLIQWHSEQFDKSEAYFTDANLQKGATHGDLRLANMLSNEDGITLIDFETFKTNGTQVFDVATFIAKALVISENRNAETPQTDEKIDAFLQAYHKERPLSAHELEALPTLVASRVFRTTALRATDAAQDENIGLSMKQSLDVLESAKKYLDGKDFHELLSVEKPSVSDVPKQQASHIR